VTLDAVVLRPDRPRLGPFALRAEGDLALAEADFPGDPLGFLLSTPCALAVVNQEDLSGETEQQNLPGSTWQYPNWRRKMRVTVEQLAPLAEKLKALLERSRPAL